MSLLSFDEPVEIVVARARAKGADFLHTIFERLNPQYHASLVRQWQGWYAIEHSLVAEVAGAAEAGLILAEDGGGLDRSRFATAVKTALRIQREEGRQDVFARWRSIAAVVRQIRLSDAQLPFLGECQAEIDALGKLTADVLGHVPDPKADGSALLELLDVLRELQDLALREAHMRRRHRIPDHDHHQVERVREVVGVTLPRVLRGAAIQVDQLALRPERTASNGNDIRPKDEVMTNKDGQRPRVIDRAYALSLFAPMVDKALPPDLVGALFEFLVSSNVIEEKNGEFDLPKRRGALGAYPPDARRELHHAITPLLRDPRAEILKRVVMALPAGGSGFASQSSDGSSTRPAKPRWSPAQEEALNRLLWERDQHVDGLRGLGLTSAAELFDFILAREVNARAALISDQGEPREVAAVFPRMGSPVVPASGAKHLPQPVSPPAGSLGKVVRPVDPKLRVNYREALAGRPDLGLPRTARTTLRCWCRNPQSAADLGVNPEGKVAAQEPLVSGLLRLHAQKSQRRRPPQLRGT